MNNGVTDNLVKVPNVSAMNKRYIVNPSLQLVGYLLKEDKRTVRVKDTRLGRVEGKITTIFNEDREKVYKDNSKFIKVFLDSDTFTEITMLTITAQKVLSAVIKRIEYNKSYVYFSSNLLAKSLDLNTEMITRGIKELVDSEWLFRSDEKYKYWINLGLVCLGNREDMYREYKKTIIGTRFI